MKQTEPQSRNESILKQLAELEAMPTEKLKERWRELNQTDPPRFSRQFMIKRMAHRIQELAFGGPSENNRKLMNRLLDDEGYDELGVKSRPRAMKRGDAFLPGTLLVKEWKGEVVFLRKVVDGVADRSYGVQVAKLAGPSTQSPMTNDGTSPRMFLTLATPPRFTTRQIVALSGSATKIERSSVPEPS